MYDKVQRVKNKWYVFYTWHIHPTLVLTAYAGSVHLRTAFLLWTARSTFSTRLPVNMSGKYRVQNRPSHHGSLKTLRPAPYATYPRLLGLWSALSACPRAYRWPGVRGGFSIPRMKTSPYDTFSLFIQEFLFLPFCLTRITQDTGRREITMEFGDLIFYFFSILFSYVLLFANVVVLDDTKKTEKMFNRI